jgi:hypothetical protein
MVAVQWGADGNSTRNSAVAVYRSKRRGASTTNSLAFIMVVEVVVVVVSLPAVAAVTGVGTKR